MKNYKKNTKYRFWHKSMSGNTYEPDRFYYTDPETSELLTLERDEDFITGTLGRAQRLRDYFDEFRYSKLRHKYPNNSGVWLWKDFILPGFPEKAIISLNEGQTDLFEFPEWYRKEHGLKNLFIKMEGRSPSESFKDRGMPVAISDALRLQMDYPDLGIKGICCASTGDTSAAAAIYSAHCKDKLSCTVLVPHEDISEAQLFQAMAHGANVIAIKHADKFDGCMKLVAEFADAHPELVLVNSKNDMRLVGQETIGLEILQDFRWDVPDWIAIPVGNGGNLSALMMGLLRAKHHKLIDRLPGIIAGQAERANPLFCWQESEHMTFAPQESQHTIASAMNINNPVSFPRIKELYKKFKIHFMSVPESQIASTWAGAMKSGANICPQTAVAIDSVHQAREKGIIKESDVVVCIGTASGIKFSPDGIKYHMTSGEEGANPYKVVEGNLRAIEAVMTT